MSETFVHQALDRPFDFREEPVPVPAEFRPKWRTALVVLLVAACHGRRSSWHQLHVLSWACRSKSNQDEFERVRAGNREPDDVVVRYDPALDRAIDLALFSGLLERRGGDVLALSPLGRVAVEQLEGSEVLVNEREFLVRVRPVSQTFVDSLVPRRA